MELELRELSKSYGSVKALNKISYTFKPGIYGILGANGAGKSTMINLITDNVSRDSNNGGNILYDGEDILKLGKKFRAIVGYMPQQQGFYEDFSPKAFLKYMAEVKGLKRKNEEGKSVAQQIDELLEVVNLTSVAYKKIGGFSGGMKQRVLLAQALLGNPKVLILDEPTAGLDPKERVRFRNIISDLAKEKIVVLSTHIVSDVSYIADTILMMKQGQFILQEPMTTVTDHIQGKVWELFVPERKADEYSRHFSVVNLHHENNMVRLRIVNETAPSADAYTVEPSLEDLFLYHFGEETQEQEEK